MVTSKKDNSNLWLGIAVIALIASIGAKFAWDGATKSLVTDGKVLSVTNPYEFAATIDGVYENGELKLNVQTNAPNGTLLDIYVLDPNGNELNSEVTINRGIGQTSLKIEDNLKPSIIKAVAVVDVAKEKQGQLAIKRYGQIGENFVGGKVTTMNGVTYSAVSEESGISYPDEETAKAALNKEFESILDGLLLMYSSIFTSIEPKENGNWENISVVITDEIANDQWNSYSKEQKDYLFAFFDLVLKEYKMVGEDIKVKIDFMDESGKTLDKNY